MYDEEYLEHHGIKGMRWGVRRVVDTATGLVKRNKNTTVKTQEKAPENPPLNGGRRMSNAELKSRITRMRLEQEYNSLLPKAPATKSKVEKLLSAGNTVVKLAKAGYTTFTYIDKGLKIYNSLSGKPSAAPSQKKKAGGFDGNTAKKAKSSVYWDPSSVNWNSPDVAGPASKGSGWSAALEIVDVISSAKS